MAGMTYSDHRKAAIGSDGGPRIGRAILVVYIHDHGWGEAVKACTDGERERTSGESIYYWRWGESVQH